LATPLTPGDQVLVLAQEGDAEQGVVIGSVWSSVDQPMAAPSGELWLQHKTGSFLKLHNDGTIALQAPVVNISGNLIVTGDISDHNGAHGTLDALRSAYDNHTHLDPQGGTTCLPSVIV
jgi:phage baseplate assembly protein gpV